MSDVKVMIINGQKIELHEDEVITEDTLQELTGGKGGDSDE